MRSALLLLGLPLLAAPPSFSVREAIRAEWHRQPPVFSEAERTQLSPADRARLELTLQRIAAPGAPALLPLELEKPTLEIWEAKAAAAKTPQERFTALFFLNRLKSAKALFSLEGLGARDSEAWPRHLHLEAGIAAARLNGCEVGPQLQGFLDGLQKAGKIDPVRAQAARLRLVMGGKEKELLPPVKATAGSVLALMDAWNRGSWEKRKDQSVPFLRWLRGDDKDNESSELCRILGLKTLFWPDLAPFDGTRLWEGLTQRIVEGLGPGFEKDLERTATQVSVPRAAISIKTTLASVLVNSNDESARRAALTLLTSTDVRVQMTVLPALRKLVPNEADTLRKRLLSGSNPIARAAAIDDMAEAPADLDALITRLWKTEEYDGVQVLLQSLGKWKLPEERRRTILVRFYEHPCWTARLDAWRELSKLDSKAPWPTAPKPSATDTAILKEAERLATAGKPVRMRLTFAGKRQVTLRLDPVNAPMNVANLVLLARKGFFNGRLVPRVVPDFVVQMGSPCDTMDGGPGYTVRCENSLTWYGPGSVGMALSGKDTGGSQFFITTNATPHLTGKYTRVGEVEDLDKALKLLDDLELGAKLERVDVLAPRMTR